MLLDDHAIMMELGKISLKGVANIGNKADTQRAYFLKNLDQVIAPHQHKKFQEAFFKEKERYYNKLINLIDILPTWPRAVRLLHLFYARKGIDPLSREALEFKQMVHRRYFPVSKQDNKMKHIR